MCNHISHVTSQLKVCCIGRGSDTVHFIDTEHLLFYLPLLIELSAHRAYDCCPVAYVYTIVTKISSIITNNWQCEGVSWKVDMFFLDTVVL